MEFPYFSPDDVQFIPNHAFSGKQAWKLPIPLGNQYGSPTLFMDHYGRVTLELESCSGHTFTEADLKQIMWGMHRLKQHFDCWQLQWKVGRESTQRVGFPFVGHGQVNTCKNCRFSCQPNDTGSCSDYASPGMLRCTCPKLRYVVDGGPIDPDSLGYGDCEGYAASIQVGPDFGCIHFQP